MTADPVLEAASFPWKIDGRGCGRLRGSNQGAFRRGPSTPMDHGTRAVLGGADRSRLDEDRPAAKAAMWSAGVTCSALVPTLAAYWCSHAQVRMGKAVFLFLSLWERRHANRQPGRPQWRLLRSPDGAKSLSVRKSVKLAGTTPPHHHLAASFSSPLRMTSSVSSANSSAPSSSRRNQRASSASSAAINSPATRRQRKSIST